MQIAGRIAFALQLFAVYGKVWEKTRAGRNKCSLLGQGSPAITNIPMGSGLTLLL